MALPGAEGHPHVTRGLGPASTALIEARARRLGWRAKRCVAGGVALLVSASILLQLGAPGLGVNGTSWVGIVGCLLLGMGMAHWRWEDSERLARRAWAAQWRELSASDLQLERFARARSQMRHELSVAEAEVCEGLLGEFEGSAGELAQAAQALVAVEHAAGA